MTTVRSAMRVLTIAQPGLAANEAVTAMLKATSAAPSGAAIRPADILARGYDVDVNLALKNDNGSTTTNFKVDAAAELAKAAAAGTLKTWISGPLASEFRVVKALNDHLDVTLDIRASKDGTVRTDVTVEVEILVPVGSQDPTTTISRCSTTAASPMPRTISPTTATAAGTRKSGPATSPTSMSPRMSDTWNRPAPLSASTVPWV